MKVHLQKTRTQNGKVVTYSIPECGKKGSSNAYLHLTSLELLMSFSNQDSFLGNSTIS